MCMLTRTCFSDHPWMPFAYKPVPRQVQFILSRCAPCLLLSLCWSTSDSYIHLLCSFGALLNRYCTHDAFVNPQTMFCILYLHGRAGDLNNHEEGDNAYVALAGLLWPFRRAAALPASGCCLPACTVWAPLPAQSKSLL